MHERNEKCRRHFRRQALRGVGANLIRDINIKMSQSNRASGGEFEIFALLRCYSALTRIELRTFRDNLSIPSIF